MRILAVDPGEKRIGLALSDPTRTIASPLSVLVHRSRDEDAARIVQLAERHGCDLIIVGQALDWDGRETLSSRRARRLAGALRAGTQMRVEMWEEYGSTQSARANRISSGVKRKHRQGHLDELAAAVILQSYLDQLAGGDSAGLAEGLESQDL